MTSTVLDVIAAEAWPAVRELAGPDDPIDDEPPPRPPPTVPIDPPDEGDE